MVSDLKTQSTPLYVERGPRIRPELPIGQIPIVDPPETGNKKNNLILQLALPLGMIVITVLVGALFENGRQPQIMIPMILGVILSSAISVYGSVEERKKRTEAKTAYLSYLRGIQSTLKLNHNQTIQFLNFTYPTPIKSLAIASDARSKATNIHRADPVSETALWPRLPYDPDFGDLRIGTGAIPATMVATPPTNLDPTNDLSRDVYRMVEDSQVLTDAPFTISLFDSNQKSGNDEPSKLITHSLGITGGEKGTIYAHMRSQVIHLTTFHTPNDLKIFVLGTEQARDAWRLGFPLAPLQRGKRSVSPRF